MGERPKDKMARRSPVSRRLSAGHTIFCLSHPRSLSSSHRFLPHRAWPLALWRTRCGKTVCELASERKKRTLRFATLTSVTCDSRSETLHLQPPKGGRITHNRIAKSEAGRTSRRHLARSLRSRDRFHEVSEVLPLHPLATLSSPRLEAR